MASTEIELGNIPPYNDKWLVGIYSQWLFIPASPLSLSPSLSLFFFFFFFDNSLEVLHTYNKRATETRHCIHMLGYHMAQ